MLSQYEQLKEKLDEIKDLSESFSGDLQAVVCKGLIDAMLFGQSASSQSALTNNTGSTLPLNISPNSPSADIVETTSGRREWPGVASFDPVARRLSISVRDWKTKSKIQQGMRCAYVILRAWERFTGEEAVSSRDVVTPVLKEHRLYDGNLRSALSKDKGIHRNSDMLWLDVPAKDAADKIIAEVLTGDVE